MHRIPHDRHLEAGAVTDADMLAPRTQEAWLRVSAAVVDGFALSSARRPTPDVSHPRAQP